MNTAMTWVKVSDLVKSNKSFQIIHKAKNDILMWCLVRNSNPVMYQEIVSDTQPFVNVYCLVEERKTKSATINKSKIKAVVIGTSHS
ncbi:hypothetical protein [Runella slithyformis]|uniref:Uncharacterized protein n=1 Tax=Runella slithyformis (strain ATCC 29530 / DSM 19594 / LMG 11500 / NCIMB 11436 / LSU 4) TaxID=761193 RepID=A0A7U3ZR10_RUNSL|nr:hypothetical protein [Runella slithyformis]AEI51728.1 hypothetical protein Runsl_5437 [Runella slithyformis DSM 19594]